MINRLILIGGHIQALGLARQAWKKGVAVELVIREKLSVARWSRAVGMTWVCNSQDEVLETLRKIATPDSMLFPTSDDAIELLACHREELERLATIALPDNNIVELFTDKRAAYQFAERNDIPHPKSYYPDDMEDVERIAKEIAYPCVVKPAVMHSFHALFGKKAYLCRDSEALLARMCTIAEKPYPIHKMLIQEYLSGGAKSLYSYGTFAVDGKPVVDIQVNRIRQNPMDFGNSTTYCMTSDHPEMEAEARKILELTHYSGMAEVEFMYDDGQYKFLEINTRAWKWHTISNQRGFSFIGAYLDYLNQRPIVQGTVQHVAWEDRLTDYTVILKEWLHGRMPLQPVLKSLRQRKEFAVWSWQDPLPALMYVLVSPVLFVKRY